MAVLASVETTKVLSQLYKALWLSQSSPFVLSS